MEKTKNKEEKQALALTQALMAAQKKLNRINVDPLDLTPEGQAQIEQRGYYPKDGCFEKQDYIMPEPPPAKDVVL